MQSQRVPIVEQIVGRLGRVLGQTFCTVRTMEIPTDFEAVQYCHSRALLPGIAHASLNVEGGEYIDELTFRRRDDNRRNHAAILAMWDLCWGRDEQWLTDGTADERYYSHDHGLFLDPSAGVWGTAEFEALAVEPRPLPDDWKDIDNATAAAVSNDLRRLTMGTITEVLRCVPKSWPVSDEQLESIGYFLQVRAPAVAQRVLNSKGILV